MGLLPGLGSPVTSDHQREAHCSLPRSPGVLCQRECDSHIGGSRFSLSITCLINLFHLSLCAGKKSTGKCKGLTQDLLFGPLIHAQFVRGYSSSRWDTSKNWLPPQSPKTFARTSPPAWAAFPRVAACRCSCDTLPQPRQKSKAGQDFQGRN